jgi:hypothetical protein
MQRVLGIVGSTLLLAVAAFCGFGFLATFEPTTNTTRFVIFRIGYAVFGIGCLAGAGFLIANAIRR